MSSFFWKIKESLVSVAFEFAASDGGILLTVFYKRTSICWIKPFKKADLNFILVFSRSYIMVSQFRPIFRNANAN